MKSSKLPAAVGQLTLERRDLIAFEQRLRGHIARFLPHAAYSLHFPGSAAGAGGAREPEYIAAERRVFLPLFSPSGPDAGSLLGVFVARGVKAAAYKSLDPRLPDIAALIMENLLLYKASICDPVTGLFTRSHFLDRAAREIDGARPDDPESAGEFGETPRPGPACPGLLVIRLHDLRQVARDHGYLFADQIMALLGETLRALGPEQGLAARIGDYELAFLLPAATGKSCRRLAAAALSGLSAVSLGHDLTRSRISAQVCAGYALYPQDMEGGVFLRSASEQARILLRKARLAAALAAEKSAGGEESPVMGFGRILAEGGRIQEMLPLSRLMVSLGSNAGAREGQRFSVWASVCGAAGAPGAAAQYKGEIVLMEVGDAGSLAEVIHLGDPAWAMQAGDVTTLLPEEVWGASRAGRPESFGDAAPDALTGLLRHGDFLARWSAKREECATFSLALVRLAPPLNDGRGGEDEADETAPPENAPANQAERLMGEAVRLARDVFGTKITGGRYGLTSLIFFHPDASPESLAGMYGELCALLGERLFPGSGEKAFSGGAVPVAVGIAGYPCLDFRRADVLENSRKALEYGMLLPHPHVGVFDSLALTISADKRFSHGDVLGAMTEYKQALLADDENALAWNSLGVCHARLGRHAEARSHFDKALASRPKECMTLYNMGYSCQCLGEIKEAGRWYARCLEESPDHVYALVRLGQLAEAEKFLTKARRLYARAGAAPGGKALSRRYLAGLALKAGKTDEAREHLHEALSLDPQNAVALQMLAGLYLDGGEDVAVAETLARQSVALRPGLKAGWLVLARSLETAGRRDEAREAFLRAGEL